MSARKPLLAGNWKMNLNHVEAVGLVQKLAFTLADKKYDAEKSECVVIPPFTDIRTVQNLVEGDKLPIAYGAQDISLHESGAYTGEVSGSMLKKLGCSYVIVGHSERREYHAESDDVVNAKAKRVLASEMTPIICVGEGLPVRQAGDHVRFTVDQVRKALAGLTPDQVGSSVIAYEPIWAIGTGEVASAEDAQEVCRAIRGIVTDDFGQATGDAVRVLYGGSVKADSIVELMSQDDVDGALVGGASLKPDEFAGIVRFYDLVG